MKRTIKFLHATRAAMTLLAMFMLTASTAGAADVTLQDDGGTKCVNMPKTGTKTLTLSDATVTTFKVYDNGGKSYNYSNSCDGTLTLTAPTGYVLQLSGSITTEKDYDNLTVYDGSSTSGTKLLAAVSSTSSGTQTAITTVVSSGQSMTLYFSSDVGSYYAGLDLTVTLISTSTEYAITVNNASDGSIASNKSTAKVNDVITLTATPNNGYLFSDLSVVDGSSNAVAVTGGWYTNNQATFTMPASTVTVTPTFTNTLTADGGLYINMPTTGTKTATIPSGVQSFKVYDDGGASSNYSNSCNGTLTLTAPEGYVLQLSGSITTENGPDKLTVYNGTSASDSKLLNAVSSTSRGTETAITTVVSSGQSMTLYFYSDDSRNYAGLDLTVTLVNPNTEYGITVSNATGGSVAASVSNASANTAKWNDVVTLTATPESGYMLSGLSVVDGSSNAVAVTDMLWYANTNTATFTMPASAVTVTPTFTNDLTSLYINMPTTGTKTATIPSDVQSFKVYDDGGKGGGNNNTAGNYSNGCSGTLTLTAPTGYVLQLSGSITTETLDKLTVYDGSSTSGTKLLNAVSSTSNGTQTAITTVISSGQSMTLYFYSDDSRNYAGLDLTVTLVNPNTEYAITVHAATGGSVAASVNSSNVSAARVNDVVTLTAAPESGYILSDLSVVDGSSNAVAVTGGWYTNNQATFTMPASTVTVTPTFTNTWTADGGLYINMPATGTKTVTIPTGVQSFKVYDDGGKDGNYSNRCDGTLTLTAPEGYLLQLSGSITTEASRDNLTVYDGSSTSGTKLLAAVSSTSSGTQTAITTVISSGQSMTLYFKSDSNENYAGLDLTVTLVPATYTITYDLAGGTVATENPATYTIESSDITLNNPTKDGYTFAGWTGTGLDAATETVTITQGSTGNRTYTATWTASETIALTANQAPDDNYWTTFYCGDAGYTIDAQENACAYTATYSDGQLTLHNQGKEIPQGTAVIIVADNNEVSMTETDLAAFSGENSLRGVDVETSTADIQSTLGDGTFYVLGMTVVGSEKHFGFHKYDGTTMAARKAFVLVGGSNAALARSLTMVFDDATGIKALSTDSVDAKDDGAWYTLDGRKLQGMPAKSGLYISNGHKIVIK